MTIETYEAAVKRLKDLREKHFIPVTDMANYLGVSRQAIYNFEKLESNSYKLLLGYLTHPAFSEEEVGEIYNILGG